MKCVERKPAPAAPSAPASGSATAKPETRALGAAARQNRKPRLRTQPREKKKQTRANEAWAGGPWAAHWSDPTLRRKGRASIQETSGSKNGGETAPTAGLQKTKPKKTRENRKRKGKAQKNVNPKDKRAKQQSSTQAKQGKDTTQRKIKSKSKQREEKKNQDSTRRTDKN